MSAQPEEQTELLLGEVVVATGGGECSVGETQTRSSGQQGIRDTQRGTYTAIGTQPLCTPTSSCAWVPNIPACGGYQALCTDGLNLVAPGGRGGAFFAGRQHMVGVGREQVSPQ